MTEKYFPGQITHEAGEAEVSQPGPRYGPKQRTPKFVDSCRLLILV